MKKIIIDCDPGVDDSVAILYALSHPDIQVLGITTGFGNTSAAQGAVNALSLVELADPGYVVPVAIGAEQPLQGQAAKPPSHIHGRNGVGNVSLPAPKGVPVTEPAAEFLVSCIRENAGDVTVVTLGRLTNLARALELEPSLPRLVNQVAVMGGTYRAAGNVTPAAEANIYGDPEAADRVFTAGFDLVLAGLDVTMKTQIHLDKLCALERLCKNDRQRGVIGYLKQALRFYMDFHTETELGIDTCPVHDPSAMLAVTDPWLFTYEKKKVRVDCGDGICRGMIVPDLLGKFWSHREITICVDVAAADAEHKLLGMFVNGK